jgi:ATP-binding protein involved in chromosome partitioning
VKDEKYFMPIKAHGIQAMSMSFLVTEKTPMVWRGPMVSGALQQLLTQTLWDDLDYLIVDMPPGTGDIQLTLSQQVPVAGAVIVTTPQDIALLDAEGHRDVPQGGHPGARRDREHVGVPLPPLRHDSAIFGSGGGERIAARVSPTPARALPLTMEIREQADGGTPTVARDPDGDDRRAVPRCGAAHGRRAVAPVRAGGCRAVEISIDISMTDD